MADQDKPKPTPPKNFQEEVADAIVGGKLDAFKKCCVGKNDINRRLLPHKELKAKPAHNPEERYINIRGPTMLMYAILCEQEEIVEYILDNKSPDVGKEVEGYNCVHLAAMIKDPRCLKLLLQHEWVQENINEPIKLPGTNQKEGEGTTALHVAVSNRRYANVILLIDDMPKVRWSQKKDKKNENPKDKEGEAPNDQNAEKPAEKEAQTIEEEEEKEADVERGSADINKKSASGSTPLYIAVFLRDYKMVRILLSGSPDTSEKSAKDKTPLDLAIEYKQANDKKKENLQEKQAGNQKKKNTKAEKEDDIDLIVEALNKAETANDIDDLEVLKKLYAPELIEHKDESSATNSEDEEQNQEDENDEPEQNEGKQEKDPAPAPEKKKSSKSSDSSEKYLRQILDQLQELNSRVSNLEKQRGFSNSDNPQSGPSPSFSKINVCCQCGASGARLCNQCHNYYCDRCFRKPTTHSCFA